MRPNLSFVEGLHGGKTVCGDPPKENFDFGERTGIPEILPEKSRNLVGLLCSPKNKLTLPRGWNMV